MKIPFNKSYLTGNEQKYIEDIYVNRLKTSGDGVYTKKVSEFIEKKFDVQKVLMTTSCTTALEMAVMLLDLNEGDEVIMPSFTFPSTANAVVLRGGKAVFADIDDTFNIDLNDLESRITIKTKAVIVVHYASGSCDMDRLMDMSQKHGFYVIEDAAQAMSATYKNKYLGTIGHFGCFSFHETKNYSCGEGGCLLINSDNDEVIHKAEIMREKGTNRAQFNRGDVEFYTWVSEGSSYLPSEILCAHLLAQLEGIDEINQLRKERYDYYVKKLSSFNDEFYIHVFPNENKQNYHMFNLIFSSKEERDSLMTYLNEYGVSAYFHYVPLHTSPMNKQLKSTVEYLPKTEVLVDCLLRLPMYPDLTFAEIDYIVHLINNFYKQGEHNEN